MKILLATPTYDRTVQQIYHQSVLRLILHFSRNHSHVEFELAMSSGTVIERIRNAYASQVLNDSSFTHLLFVDSDMGFRPSLIEKMLAFDEPVVGCIYPRRKFDLDALRHWSFQIKDSDKLRAAAQPYVLEEAMIREAVREGEEDRYRFVNGFVRVTHVGAGVLLIKREALQNIKERFRELYVMNPGPTYTESYPFCSAGLLQCFSPYQRQDGLFVAEDVAFSERWTRGCEGQLWACLNEPISHAGAETFSGAFLEKLVAIRDARQKSGGDVVILDGQ